MTKRNEKHAILTMGLPGAGKSYILNRDFETEVEEYVMVDPDLEKQQHPEYDPENPAAIHEWSKKQANKKRYNAIANDKNMIIDGTGTNSEKMVKRIVELQSAGYTTEVVYVQVSLQTSLKRNAQRPRTVPENIIREKAELISTSFEIISRYADEITVIDNN
ncbi:MAG: zeta toxin family protein [Bacillota bacterium]